MCVFPSFFLRVDSQWGLIWKEENQPQPERNGPHGK
jgi:hypothetical protein